MSKATRAAKREALADEVERLERECKTLAREVFNLHYRVAKREAGDPYNFSYSESTIAIGPDNGYFTLRGARRGLSRRLLDLQYEANRARKALERTDA